MAVKRFLAWLGLYHVLRFLMPIWFLAAQTTPFREKQAHPQHPQPSRGCVADEMRRRLLPAVGTPPRPANPGRYPSPDGRYFIHVKPGDAVPSLSLVATATGRQIRSFPNVNQFIWLPSGKHGLIVAGNGVYSPAFLILWDESGNWRSLSAVRKPFDETIYLEGISHDGRYAAYRHAHLDVPNTKLRAQRKKLRWVRLPVSHRLASPGIRRRVRWRPA